MTEGEVQLLTPAACPVLTPEHDRILGLRAAELSLDALPEHLSIPLWIKVFEPVVTQDRQGEELVFSLNFVDAEYPNPGEYGDFATASCAAHNALPKSVRASSGVEQIPKRFAELGEACVASGSFASYW